MTYLNGRVTVSMADTDSGGDGEVAVGGVVAEIVILDTSERNAANAAVDGHLGRVTRAEWNAQVVS